MQSVNTKFSISARSKPKDYPIEMFILDHFNHLKPNIDSVFGFVDAYTPMYGGRVFDAPELSDDDVNSMYDIGLTLKLPLTNHYTTREDYLATTPMLRKYHREGNTIALVKDEVVQWIREDFPLYNIEASVIKNLNSKDKIDHALTLYDDVVLHAEWNDDINLVNLDNKDRIRLFANMGCAYNCPSKICYPSISKINRRTGTAFKCSQPLIMREVKTTSFDIAQLESLGFSKFKVLRQKRASCY